MLDEATNDTGIPAGYDETEFAIGDIVTLITGSPDMVVISTCECDTVEVAWYDDDGMNIEVFPVEALVAVDMGI